MYQMIGTARLLANFGILTSIIALIYGNIYPPENASGLWKIASVSSTFTGLLVLIIGQTPLFTIICRLPIIRDYFPHIDGNWIGNFTSNYNIIAKSFGIKNNNDDLPIKSSFKIKARLFDVKISAVSISPKPDYMWSDTTAFRIKRCSMTDRIVIHYAYEAFIGAPHDNDVVSFHGAARLTILGDAQDLRLEGVYWTDRNWQKGMNTAGTLVLSR